MLKFRSNACTFLHPRFLFFTKNKKNENVCLCVHTAAGPGRVPDLPALVPGEDFLTQDLDVMVVDPHLSVAEGGFVAAERITTPDLLMAELAEILEDEGTVVVMKPLGGREFSGFFESIKMKVATLTYDAKYGPNFFVLVFLS